MPLPHFSQARASRENFEPVYPNLFEVTFLPPNNIDGALLLEHVNTVGGLDAINPVIDPVTQKYKFTDRSYAGMPAQTFVDITVNFSLNLNDSNQIYIYKTLYDWYRRIYDPETGEQGLKTDYVGTLIVVQFNRPGDIFRKVTLRDTFPTGNLVGLDALDYSTPEPMTIEVVWRSDHWTQELT